MRPSLCHTVVSWQLAAVVLLLVVPSKLAAQETGSWIIRLGAVGSGTADEGTWTFSSSTGLGDQVFEFSNSWGVAVGGEYIFAGHIHLGVHLTYTTTDFALTVTPGGNGTTFTSRDKPDVRANAR